MKHYDNFLFDWDGTIAMTLHIWLAALRQALEKRGYHFDDNEIGANYTAFKDSVIGRSIPDIDIVLSEALITASKTTKNVSLYPDAAYILTELAAKQKHLALVTTSLHEYIDPLLKSYKLKGIFNAVICGDDVSRIKPDAEPLNRALALLHAQPEKSVMIGDSDKDILAAHAAGIDSILVYPPGHSIFYDIASLQQLQPTHVLYDFKDLLTLS